MNISYLLLFFLRSESFISLEKTRFCQNVFEKKYILTELLLHYMLLLFLDLKLKIQIYLRESINLTIKKCRASNFVFAVYEIMFISKFIIFFEVNN